MENKWLASSPSCRIRCQFGHVHALCRPDQQQPGGHGAQEIADGDDDDEVPYHDATLAFIALISINLGVLNLLPVPVLDGGHLVFFFIELIFRRPVPQRIREYAQQIGMVLLLGLMVLAFYNDIIRYFVTSTG